MRDTNNLPASDLISLLLSQGGPILRWLVATELIPGDPKIDCRALLDDLLACSDVQHWLGLLGHGPIHHSMDASVENVLAKLGEFGLRSGMTGLDPLVLPYCAVGEGERYYKDALIIVPFLMYLGYSDEPSVAAWLDKRINLLYESARMADYDLYMDESERQCLPPSQRKMHGLPKPFYKQKFNHHWGYLGLPTCYDLLALAYLPKSNIQTKLKVEKIIAYLLDPAFQETPGGYIWNPELHRSYAAGRVFLACLPRPNELEKLVLFMELLSHFECGKASTWYRENLDHLESFRTEDGTFCFPPRYLSEKHNYYLYGGMHMGLGESPRNAHALELESTFRMLRLKGRL